MDYAVSTNPALAEAANKGKKHTSHQYAATVTQAHQLNDINQAKFSITPRDFTQIIRGIAGERIGCAIPPQKTQDYPGITPMIKPQLDHIGLNVQNLDQSLAFYQELFGFTVIERWDEPKQAFVGAGDTVLGLMEMPDYGYRAHTMAHLAFPCEPADFPAIAEKVRDLGLEIVSGPKPQRGGETVLFRDPSGNILEVCYPAIAEWRKART